MFFVVGFVLGKRPLVVCFTNNCLAVAQRPNGRGAPRSSTRPTCAHRWRRVVWPSYVTEISHSGSIGTQARHYPPNDWGCGCYVRGTRSKRRAANVGGDPSKRLAQGWDALDPKTGAPKGIGKGWNYAPDSTVSNTIRSMTRKTIKWPYVLAKEFMADLPEATVNDFARSCRQQPTLKDATRSFVKRVQTLDGKPHSEIADIVGRQYLTWGRLTSEHVGNLRQIGMDADGYDFTMEVASVQHIRKHLNDDDLSLEDVISAPSLLDSGAAFAENVQFEDRVRGTAQVSIDIIVNSKPVGLVFQRRRSRRMLTLVTMFKVK